MRCITYARVSKDKSGRARSVTEQQSDLRRWVADRGWDLVDEIEDVSISASRHERRTRPGWERLCDLVEHGKCDVVAVWESSRSTRDLEVFVPMRKLLREHGVLLLAGGTLVDFNDAGQSMSAGHKAVSDEYESEIIRERTMRAHAANAEQGRPHGPCAYGYVRTYDRKGNVDEQLVDPETGPVVRRIADAILSGSTYTAIADELNAEGTPAPKGGEWYPVTVQKLIRRKVYAGLRDHNGTTYPGTWDGIVTVAEHAAILDATSGRSGRSTGKRSAPALLTGVAECAVCHGKLAVKKDGKLTYFCRTGFHVQISKAETDETVIEAIALWLDRPDTAAAIAAASTESMGLFANRTSELKAQLADAIKTFRKGELTAATLGEIEKDINAEIQSIEDEARRLTGAVALPSSGAEWRELPTDAQKAILRRAFRVTVDRRRSSAPRFDGGRIGIEPLA